MFLKKSTYNPQQICGFFYRGSFPISFVMENAICEQIIQLIVTDKIDSIKLVRLFVCLQ